MARLTKAGGRIMKIKFYGYNAFLIESGDKKIAIDPGALFFTGSGLQRFSQNLNGKASHIFL
jgi:L-ascorbate metabolism protein UlaG (beta-lactamase superfamily)